MRRVSFRGRRVEATQWLDKAGIMLRTLRILGFCGLAACGDATGAEQIPNIDGGWTYTTTWSWNGLSCSHVPSVLSLSQTGGTFTGTLETSDANCTLGNQPLFTLFSFGDPKNVNGTVNAAGDVTFDLLNPEGGHHTGRVSDGSMSGSFTAILEFFETGDPFEASGNWSANR